MPGSFLSPLSFRNSFIVLALVGSAMLCIYRLEIFTDDSLAETFVLGCSAMYLLVKYLMSRTILRYQKGGYQPSKAIRRRHDVLIFMAARFILPICTDFIFACSFLLFLKYLPIFNSRNAANFIYSIYEFNREHIKFPLFLAGGIVGGLTLVKWLSDKFYKRYRTAARLVIDSLKVVSVLLLFINVDSGMETNNILYAIHKDPVKPEQQKTLNVSKKYKEKVRQAAQAFADNVLSGVREDLPSAATDGSNRDYGDDPGSSEFLRLIMDHTSRIYEERPDLSSDFSNFRSNYSVEEQATIHNIFSPSRPPVEKAEFKTTNLSRTVATMKPTVLDDVITILNDEKQSIREESESTGKRIARDFLGDFLGNVCLLDQLAETVHFPGLFDCSIFKEKAFDLVKEKIGDGFLYLLSCKTVSTAKVKAVIRAVRSGAKNAIQACLVLAQQKASLLRKYYTDLQEFMVRSKSVAYDAAHPTNDIDYEQGLKIKTDMLGAKIKGSARQHIEDQIRDALRKRYPSMDDVTLERNVDLNFDNYTAKVQDDIDLQTMEINAKMYRDFSFVRDQFTSGGIFFGRPIHGPDPGKGPASPADFYPSLSTVPGAITLLPSAVWTERRKDQLLLFVQSREGVYQYEEPLDSDLFISAYRFVFEEDTYPSLIDMFYKPVYDSFVDVPAYHKAVLHNEAVKHLFSDADQYIFKVLDERINYPTLDRMLELSRAAYRAQQDSFAKYDGYSRLFDSCHLLTVQKPGYCLVHSDIFFSVVQTLPREQAKGLVSRYKEITSISNAFNDHKGELIDENPALQRIHRFAGYQALLRTVRRNNVDVFDLFDPGIR